jgi:Holliday junction resolvase RusA-like endonuclease
MATFWVAGDPAGWKRAMPRRGKGRRFYTDTSGPAALWRQLVEFAAAQVLLPRASVRGTAKPKPRWPVPVQVDLTFAFRRPKDHFVGKSGKLQPDAPALATCKPDRDNADKLILDSLTGLGWWVDDAHVVTGLIQKVYTVDDPGVRVTARWGVTP